MQTSDADADAGTSNPGLTEDSVRGACGSADADAGGNASGPGFTEGPRQQA